MRDRYIQIVLPPWVSMVGWAGKYGSDALPTTNIAETGWVYQIP